MRLIDENEYQEKLARLPMELRTYRKAVEVALEMPTIKAIPLDKVKQIREKMMRYSTLIDGIDTLEQEPRKGKWVRMSDLSEKEDDRYKCTRCGNIVHYKDKMNLYTFSSWCARCGSDNGNHINYEVEEISHE